MHARWCRPKLNSLEAGDGRLTALRAALPLGDRQLQRADLRLLLGGRLVRALHALMRSLDLFCKAIQPCPVLFGCCRRRRPLCFHLYIECRG